MACFRSAVASLKPLREPKLEKGPFRGVSADFFLGGLVYFSFSFSLSNAAVAAAAASCAGGAVAAALPSVSHTHLWPHRFS
jgi:hypothetical protein